MDFTMTVRREYNTEYYDAFTTQTADTRFYARMVTSKTDVLELGCGTGRVTSELAGLVNTIVGVDISQTMIDRARQKVGEGASFILGDITSLRLERQFDLIIAPFRVMQALEHTAQVDGLFTVIRSHLAPGGLAILNVFKPNFVAHEMAQGWPRSGEGESRQAILANADTLVTSDIRQHLDADKQVLFPDLVYHRYRDGVLIDTFIHSIVMRYYYPAEFLSLIEAHGGTVVDTWGGYEGERYGEGNELVVAFRF
jgi:SAM-dependent methyltransferase